jgi:hypothetical protein
MVIEYNRNHSFVTLTEVSDGAEYLAISYPSNPTGPLLISKALVSGDEALRA